MRNEQYKSSRVTVRVSWDEQEGAYKLTTRPENNRTDTIRSSEENLLKISHAYIKAVRQAHPDREINLEIERSASEKLHNSLVEKLSEIFQS